MEGLVGEWLKEGNMVLGWSSNKLGDLVSGTVTEFRLFLDVNGIKCVMTNSKVDTVAEIVIFVNHVARVGAVVKGKVVMQCGDYLHPYKSQ